MSDTDDGFDEEAVRRELREKYEDEREDRETTARMSELLLQGATMTNQHCDRCGSPIFRYDGQEFCPTCQHEAQQQGAADTQQQATGENQQQATGESQQEAVGGNQGRASDESTADASEAATTGEADGSANADAHASRAAERRAPPSQTDADQSPADASSASQQRTGGRGGSDAEDALESSISALARRAAGADDPRTATEYMEAAREAAEALAALRHNA